MFRRIFAAEFPPFAPLKIEFPEVKNRPVDLAEVQLLTGINGAGKTRLLTLLAGLMGNPGPLHRRLKGVDGSFFITASNGEHDWEALQRLTKTGERFQASGGGCQWNSMSHFAQWCHGVPAFAYSGSAYVEDTKVSVMAAVPAPERSAALSFVRLPDQSAALLQAITNLTLQAGLEARRSTTRPEMANRRVTPLISAVERTVSEITGIPFQFNVSPYPEPQLVVQWGANQLQFNLLPDGLRSVVGWLVHAVVMLDAKLQGKRDLAETEAVFLLDEIESHLHPAWQRRVLPAFQRLFPKAQIIIATHSPFVISSLNVGWIHRLTLGAEGKAEAQPPVAASAGDSYMTAVEEILGVKETFDPETELLLSDFRRARNNLWTGDANALSAVRELAQKLAGRSMELDFLLGKEMSQIDRQMKKAKGS